MMVELSDLSPSWSPVRNARQVLTCLREGSEVGSISVGLGALESEARAVLVDFVKADPSPEYRDGLVANWLVDKVVEKWPDTPLRGGPLSQDEGPGPAFRLRTWCRGIQFHDGGCEFIRRGLEQPPETCQCLARLLPEVERRRIIYQQEQSAAQSRADERSFRSLDDQ